MTKNQKIILFLLAAINFTHILDFMIMMPLGAYLMPYFNISPLEFSILVSAYTISAGVSGFLSAFFVDNFDRKKILITAFVLFLLGTLACGLAPSYNFLFAARVFAGIFGGLIGAQVVSIISDTFSYEVRGKAMGSIMGAFAVASTLGMPFALFLANKISWHAPFIFVAVFGVFLVPLLMKYLPKMDAHLVSRNTNIEVSRFEVIKNIFKHPKQLKALLFTFLMMGGHFLTIPLVNPYMTNNVGYTKEFTPLIYLIGGIASFISANILGRLSDQYGKFKIYSICIFAAFPLILIITNLPYHTAQFLSLVVFGLWFGVSSGRGVAGGALVSEVVEPQHRGSFQSFNSSMQQLGTGLASLVSGLIVIKDPVSLRLIHYDWVGYLSIIILFISYLIARNVFKGK